MFFLGKYNFFHDITRFNPVDDIKPLGHSPKAGMHAIQVSRMVTAVAYEKLGAACIGPAVGHRHDAPVVVLLLTGCFTGNAVSGSARTRSQRATTLDDKTRNNAVKTESVIESLADQLFEIGHRTGSVIII